MKTLSISSACICYYLTLPQVFVTKQQHSTITSKIVGTARYAQFLRCTGLAKPFFYQFLSCSLAPMLVHYITCLAKHCVQRCCYQSLVSTRNTQIIDILTNNSFCKTVAGSVSCLQVFVVVVVVGCFLSFCSFSIKHENKFNEKMIQGLLIVLLVQRQRNCSVSLRMALKNGQMTPPPDLGRGSS